MDLCTYSVSVCGPSCFAVVWNATFHCRWAGRPCWMLEVGERLVTHMGGMERHQSPLLAREDQLESAWQEGFLEGG